MMLAAAKDVGEVGDGEGEGDDARTLDSECGSVCPPLRRGLPPTDRELRCGVVDPAARACA